MLTKLVEPGTAVPLFVVGSDVPVSELVPVVDVKLAGAPLGDDSPVKDSSVVLPDVLPDEELEGLDETLEEVSSAPPDAVVDEKS